MVTIKSLAAKHRFLRLQELQVKRGRCLVIDPNNAEVRLKVHRLSCHLPNSSIRATLEPFGGIQDVSRDAWNIPGVKGVESTPRIVRMTLRDGITLNDFRHQLCTGGGYEFVVVLGRPPLCHEFK